MMVKTPNEDQVYAVLMDAKKEDRVHQMTSPGRRLVTAGLLVILSVTLAAIMTFHLWVTWQLQQRVTALQVQVDGLLALDLPELRSQFGDLYDLRDLSISGLRGLPTSADEDHVFLFLFLIITCYQSLITRVNHHHHHHHHHYHHHHHQHHHHHHYH